LAEGERATRPSISRAVSPIIKQIDTRKAMVRCQKERPEGYPMRNV
jgi:hypothetical protein